MAIEEYRRKRNFAKTPEPQPEATPQAQPEATPQAQPEATPQAQPQARTGACGTFVVHRHEARSLHYDFRVNAGGALVCWAVPKGFSYAPSDKRLAVRTEDHPLEYESFAGVIPKGQYGAGNMTIWDSGEYEIKKSASIEEALAKGEVKLVLEGRRLRGEWHLVRTKGGEGKDWLLFKAKDRYVGSGSDLFGSADLSRVIRRPMPTRVSRMESAEGYAAFSDPVWLFETAFPGKRVQVSLRGPDVRLQSRDGDLAPKLPAVCAALARVRAQTALLDGVVVALDKDGIPSKAAMEAQLASDGGNALLYVFDILYAEEWDLRRMPLVERKAALRALVAESARLLVVDPVVERGEELARAAAESGLSAIMAKKADSPYKAGRSDDWRMIALDGNALASGGKGPAQNRLQASALPAISHPRKVYWPDQGYTKEDLVRYYDRVANFLLPYLEERPIHMYRWPDGVRGKSFYQKQVPEGFPDWVRR